MFGLLTVGLICTTIAGAAQSRGRWQLLGDADAGFEYDQDRLNVGRNQGPFRQLRIEVRDAPVEIREVTVTFGDGKQFKPRIPARLNPGRESHVIDLPAGRRSIDAVTFVYRTINRHKRNGKVLLYGR
jgi:hypothetical protein